jgi:hypothetical protein
LPADRRAATYRSRPKFRQIASNSPRCSPYRAILAYQAIVAIVKDRTDRLFLATLHPRIT